MMTPEIKTRIAVIVVNYGTADLAIAAVESVLARRHGGHPVEVHLLDNASPGGDGAEFVQVHAARGWGERVTLWLEKINHGFGRGNNVVLSALLARPAPPDYVFLLNPDATLENEALDLLACTLEADPGLAAVGAGVSLPSGEPVSAAFRFPSALSEFVHAVNFGPLARLFPGRTVALPPDQPAGTVDWVTGAAVMFRLDALRRIGLFDPDFFLYYEEVELMHRLARTGYRTAHVPQARVQHFEGAATQVKSGVPERRARPAYWYQSWLLYFRKTAGRSGALRTALALIAGAALNAPLAQIRGQAPSPPLGFWHDFPRHVLLPLLGFGQKAGTRG